MALFLDIEPGDTVRIGQSSIVLEAKSGRRARLRIDSTEDVTHSKGGSESTLARSAPTEPAPDTGRKPIFTRPARFA